MIEKEPEIITVEEKKCIGTYVNTSLKNDITPQAWQQFMPRQDEVKNRKDNFTFHAIQLFENPDTFKTFDPTIKFENWATVEVSQVDEIPAGMSEITVPNGLYAKFRYKGSVKEFPKAMSYIFGTWLPKVNYTLDHRPHFAVMGKDYLGPDNPNSEEDIYIPIKEK